MSPRPSPAGAPQPLHLLIVDDHAMVREGLRRLLEDTDAAWSVAEAAGGFEALELMRRQPVDLVIADLSMPGMSGLDLIRRLHAEFPRARVLVLSMHAEEQYALRAFRAGAHGYLSKESPADELVGAVRKVGGGGAYVSAGLAEQVVQQLHHGAGTPAHAQLSDRELEVLRLLVAGRRISDIAAALHLSVKTVSTHKSRLQEKLRLPTTAALIRWGLEQGLAQEEGPVTDLAVGIMARKPPRSRQPVKPQRTPRPLR